MITEKQKLQRNLFILKGSLCKAAAILKNAEHNELFSQASVTDVSVAITSLDCVINNFDKEVGW